MPKRLKHKPIIGSTPGEVSIFKIYADIGPGRSLESLKDRLKGTDLKRSERELTRMIENNSWDILCEKIDGEVSERVGSALAQRKAMSVAHMADRLEGLLESAFSTIEKQVAECDGEVYLGRDPIKGLDNLINMYLKVNQYRDKKNMESNNTEKTDNRVTVNLIQMIKEAAVEGEDISIRDFAEGLAGNGNGNGSGSKSNKIKGKIIDVNKNKKD